MSASIAQQGDPQRGGTAANVGDRTILPDLLHGDETRVWGDQAYRGKPEAIREVTPAAKDFTNRRCKHRGVVDRGREGKEPHQVARAGQGGAPVPGHQAGVRLCPRAVPRAGEERTPAVRDLRACQFVHPAPPTGVMLAGDVRSKRAKLRSNRQIGGFHRFRAGRRWPSSTQLRTQPTRRLVRPLAVRVQLTDGQKLQDAPLDFVQVEMVLVERKARRCNVDRLCCTGRGRPKLGHLGSLYGCWTYSGRPSSSIRFNALTAIATSVARRRSVRDRSPSPMTRLKGLMSASTRARQL